MRLHCSSVSIAILLFVVRLTIGSPKCEWDSDQKYQLRCNGVRNLGELPFADFSAVENLRLCYGGSAVYAFRSTDFESLKRLQRLEISSCDEDRRVELTFKSLSLSKLDSLDVRNCRLEFGSLSLPRLRRLSIERCDVIDRFGFLRNASALYELILRNDDIDDVEPDVFVELVRLELLDISGNRLSSLDGRFRNLKNLRELNLERNLIRNVTDATFVGLTSLRKLYLGGNLIEDVGSLAFQSLIQLEWLSLDDNNVNRLGDRAFYGLDNLVLLNISHNNIVGEFRSEWCPPMLTTLDLSHNNITSFNGTSGCNSIRTLNLGFNALKTVSGNLLPPSVRTAFLNDNSIAKVDRTALTLTPVLQFLSLRNNLLESLVLDRPKSGSGLIELNVASNRFVCNCYTVWLQQVLVGGGSPFYVQNMRELTCRNRFSKTRAKTLQIFTVTDPQDLMCTFDESTENVCILWKFEGDPESDNVQVCNPAPCPKGCTCFRSDDWTKIHAQCTGAGLTGVPTPLHPITTSLFLDYNNIGRLKAGDFPKFRFLFELNLTACAIEDIGANAFDGLGSLLRLYLKGNVLRQLAPKLFANLTNLVELDLSHNLFSSLDPDLFRPLVNLLELYINDNRLVQFPVWIFGPTRIYDLAIHDNPWSCDCNFTALFRRWMQNATRKLRNSDRIYCQSDDEPPLKVSLIAYNESNCYEGRRLPPLNDAQVTVLTTALCVLTIVVVVSVLVFVYRREMQVLIYSRYGVRLFRQNRDEEADDAVFDAFVSYSELDEDFVVNDLLPGLEGIANPYRLCLHHRDFVVGELITENILNAVQKSRRTILVFSANFVGSDFCRYEFKMAHCRMLEDRCRRVIVILLGEVPKQLPPEMKLYLQTNTYLAWGDRLFWEKLYFALPERKVRSESGDGNALLHNR